MFIQLYYYGIGWGTQCDVGREKKENEINKPVLLCSTCDGTCENSGKWLFKLIK